MANTGRLTLDGGETMRYAEYTSNSNTRSDAEIDRRFVSLFLTFLEFFKQRNSLRDCHRLELAANLSDRCCNYVNSRWLRSNLCCIEFRSP